MKTCSQNSDFQHCLIVSYNRATTEHLACIAGGFVLESSKWAAKPHSSHGFAAHWCTCQPNHHLHKELGTTVSHCLYILAAVWSLKGRTTLTVSNEKKKVEKPIIKKKTFLECTSFLNHSFIISALLYNIYIFFLWNIGHFFLQPNVGFQRSNVIYWWTESWMKKNEWNWKNPGYAPGPLQRLR